MKTLIIQFDIKRNRTKDNLDFLDKHLVGGYDLIVLPEMFNCGFSKDAIACASVDGQITLDWMKKKAQELNTVICGSTAFAEGEHVFNRLFVVNYIGNITYYDKRHLFSMGGVESNNIYTAGKQRVIVKIGEMRCLLQICYDLRFPVFSRNRNDYDIAIYVANWPASRNEAWLTLLRARAIENQCYVIGANRIGSDDGILYSGNSVLFGPYGETIAIANNDKQLFVEGVLPKEPLEHFRNKFPVLRDADKYELI